MLVAEEAPTGSGVAVGFVYLLAFAVLLLVSVVMLWLGDKLDATGMAVTRFLASVQAPVTAQYGYPDVARDEIAVVLYDQEFLKHTDSAWPLSYQDHADWLLRLAAEPANRPKAIMLDVTFGQRRNDPSLPALKQALCTLQLEYKVPVFLAALPSPDNDKLMVRSGLAQEAGEPSCFTLVGVDYIPDTVDGLAWTYQLTRHRTETGWDAGPGKGRPSYRSAAMAMAEDVAHIGLGEETVPMALVWGHNTVPQSHLPARLQNCRAGEPDWRNAIPPVLRQLWEEPREPLCPYHRTLSMAQVGELSEQDLAPYLSDRYVFVGANVPAYNDFARSPVHGLIPGVYLHAMALDNFLTYQGDYKLDLGWSIWPAKQLIAAALATIGLMFCIHVMVSRARPGLLRCTSQCYASKVPWRCKRWVARRLPKKPRKGVLSFGPPLRHTAGGIAWIAQTVLLGVAAVGMIALIQHGFRVGMLPLVELVNMTLFAQGLGYMNKLRSFFFGD